MPLSRQLWLAVILIVLTSFVGSFAIGMHGARSFLEQELHRKNADSANSLALSISQLSKDPVTIGLQLTAYFDSGQYEAISITSLDGNVLAERTRERTDATVPAWFASVFPLQVEPGHAQIMDGWMQFGVVRVVARVDPAHESLWAQAGMLLLWLALTGAVGGLAGLRILRPLRAPLAAMADQADAITDRNFLTVAEPRIPELRRIARAMNDLVRRLHNRTMEEAGRLEALRRELQRDPATGLADRDGFMEQLCRVSASAPADVETPEPVLASLLVIRLHGLDTAGEAGAVVTQAAARIADAAGKAPGRQSARLARRDFALLIPDRTDAETLARELAMELADVTAPDGCNVGALRLRRGDRPEDLLADDDTALILAETAGAGAWHALPDSPPRVRDWRRSLAEALEGSRLELALRPVLGPDGAPLHWEAVPHLRMQPGEWPAADPLALAGRLGLTPRIERHAVRLALARLRSGEAGGAGLALDLSEETAADPASGEALREILAQDPQHARGLRLAVPGPWAAAKPEAFTGFRDAFAAFGCRIGLTCVGHSSGGYDALMALRPDYLKIDGDLVRGISVRKACQHSLGELCDQARAAGIAVIAAGVRTAAERRTLIALGCEGVTGPGVK